MDRGIAGFVARTGEGVNITNAYEDERFNPEVDSKTGYHTTSVLCMPIYVRKSIMGVIQMVNKRQGRFTQVDEEAFETFALYCGLALHHSKLYEKIRRSETKHRVAMEVLSYHSVCNRDEVAKLKRAVPQAEAMNLMLNFDFNQNTLSEIEKPLYAVCMFDSLFKEQFQYAHDDVIRFVLTAILMTSCDLIASAKPWSIQTEIVKVIFEEFYEQGDAERVNGKEPIPMMDRQKVDELPLMQIGFMKGICVECYDLISKVIPETSQLRERARTNLKKWSELAKERAEMKEEILKQGLAEAEAVEAE
uniref:PDEase domain-containing protein n=1 Tax=Panagrolaimus sp. JU765 TaxID=591449 RepID=A0AC34QR29_9BILA